MDYNWRSALREYIEDYYVREPQEWFDIIVSPSGRLNLTVISDRFVNMLLPQRREQIEELLSQLKVPLSPGFLSLYTVEEAVSLELSRPPEAEERAIYNWFDLAQQAANASDSEKTLQRESRIPRTIAFYSFKGGVGRTTALAHVAVILAMRGRKVVAVDLDLEAPGLSSALNLSPLPEHGLIDYFYERSYMPADVEPTIAITDIFSEIRIPDAPGRLFVVPAGSLDLDYLAKVDDLRSVVITERGEDLWSTFYREITEQLQPDIILLDSRTGINEWGAFSLLRAADKGVIFLYPNEQNSRGVGLLLEALMNTISISFVFSPVPFVNEGGMEMVRKQMDVLRTVQRSSGLNGKEPIVIPYITGIAMASSYPVRELLSYYMPIANVIDEETNAIRLSTVLADREYRQEVLESLTFPELDVTKDSNVNELFQRTADFDKFLDKTTCLIRGRKGTGKTRLYWLLLKHKKAANRLTYGRLGPITCFSAHGAFFPSLTKNDFQLIDQAIIRYQGSWEPFWRAYLLLRMYIENHLFQLLEGSKFKPLQTIFNKMPKEVNRWNSKYVSILIEMVINPDLDIVVKDILSEIDRQQKKKSREFWFLYDNLDNALENELREKVLIGLFQFVRDVHTRRLTATRFKIFLREDVWSLLTFDNKNYFHGRDLLLQWTFTDFLRLALRQAMLSEKFKEVVNRFSPIENIDQASEERLNEAMQLLWGNRGEDGDISDIGGWVYGWLTDASSTTFPHSLKVFLREATKVELHIGKERLFPVDRLLSVEALQEGLIKAAEERCDEIREEYPELRSFFDFLAGKKVQTVTEELHKAWLETKQPVQPEWQDFKTFVSFLESIGLIGTTRHGPSPSDTMRIEINRVGNIYMHGFHMI